jgi:5-methylcytosine-specific restriction endonuclease McrA
MDLNQKIARQFNYRCVIDFKRYNHIHHILPKSLGGKDDEENLVPLCMECHELIHSMGAVKWTYTLQQFRKRRLKEIE